MIPNPAALGSGGAAWTLTISADAANVNLKTELEALYGSFPASAINAVVTVASGVRVYSNSDSTPAMTTGGTFLDQWPNDSTLKIINYGKIRGAGGDGGADSGGGVGGTALLCSSYGPDTINIDNTSVGNIFGGGGGGGAGGRYYLDDQTGDCGGGGGGGGQGDVGGVAGVGAGGAFPGGDGTAGNVSGGGTGGSGGADGVSGSAGGGGIGGGWGGQGYSGGDGSGSGVGDPGYSGGAGGKAVDKNGRYVTWIAGNNATQVKGAVS